jgi:hypothetical protein
VNVLTAVDVKPIVILVDPVVNPDAIQLHMAALKYTHAVVRAGC